MSVMHVVKTIGLEWCLVVVSRWLGYLKEVGGVDGCALPLHVKAIRMFEPSTFLFYPFACINAIMARNDMHVRMAHVHYITMRAD